MINKLIYKTNLKSVLILVVLRAVRVEFVVGPKVGPGRAGPSCPVPGRAKILIFFNFDAHAQTCARRARAVPGGTIHRVRAVPVPGRDDGRVCPYYSCPSSSST
ncbi:hypothetical protein RND81_06G053400 [Saponaria officinalis]|uniref:Secreted protein n=1 Tax=Saponaria officinalis TaxID=3572 RepID=A0AAW1K423_SAPOF